MVQHFDLIGAALGNEDVSVRRSEKKSRIAKPAGVRIDLKSRRHAKLRVGWTPDDTRWINCQKIRTRPGQVFDRDFATHARRIAGPIAHRRLADSKPGVFSARRAVRGQGETERDTDRAKNRMNSAAIFHSRLQSLPTERSRGYVET